METTISEDVYLPGEKICQSTHARSGPGTYVRDGHIYASLIGKAKIEREVASKTGEKTNHGSTLPTVSIKSLKDNSVVIPHIGSLVIAKITSVNTKYAKCSILSINSVITKENFPGQINRKDVRATEKDKIEISKSFRCGDIVIARVISLGDTNSYLLSCAENELGVVIAYSEAGGRLIPVSWNEMQCPITMLKEQRKVAKVQEDYINYVEPSKELDEAAEIKAEVAMDE